jgi:hypothetical protein
MESMIQARPAKIPPMVTIHSGRDLRLPQRYWFIVLIGAVFTLARFREAFLVLRAQDIGLTLRYVPLILIAMNIFYAALLYPGGVASDHFSRRALLIGEDLVLAAAGSPLLAFVAASLCVGGAHGVHASFVGSSPTRRR